MSGREQGKDAKPTGKGAVEDLARMVARHNAMNRSMKVLPHGSRLYEVECGWESFMMESDQEAIQVTSRRGFEDAIRNPDCNLVFVSREAALTLEIIETTCQRYGITKTIFQEVGKDRS